MSGNSFYKVGTEADLRRGRELIDLGVARIGWTPLNQFDPDYTLKSIFESMTTDELKEVAREKGIKVGRMKRETIIERLMKHGNN